MKGLELSEAFYREYGEPMLREQFPAEFQKIAVGLVGSGSEVLGFDDEVSEDHDFAPGFCIFLPSEEKVDRRTAFLMERAYAKLPREFRGYKRPSLSPVGGSRVGVIRMADFFLEKVGEPEGRLSDEAWLRIPSFYLLEAVNGKIYADGSGVFSEIRERLSRMPEDVRKKRLAGQLFLMGQAGGYNYPRCLRHGETGAAQLALGEYVRAALSAAFLLAGKYEPYYKWSFRALREWEEFGRVFEDAGALAESLEYLASSGNDPETAEKKIGLIQDVDLEIGCAGIRAGLIRELPEDEDFYGAGGRPGDGVGLSLSGRILSENPDRGAYSAGGFRRGEDGLPFFDPERGAYEVNDSVRDGRIRALHILYTV